MTQMINVPGIGAVGFPEGFNLKIGENLSSYIDNVCVYNRTLTLAEVGSLYAGTDVPW